MLITLANASRAIWQLGWRRLRKQERARERC